MGRLTSNPFTESCCDGGQGSCETSTLPCGCDPGEHYIAPTCWKHQKNHGEEDQAAESAPAKAKGWSSHGQDKDVTPQA